ncbi:MAG TPA: hypothetical protein VEY11_02415 [Pyrinomonadaceae bacterium]|nr:hypothetical protein [Pyrinomonadaceae bacterium]
MNTGAKLFLLWLSLLCALAYGTATSALAQRTARKTPRPPVVAQPAPLAARPVADKLAPAGWMRYEIGDPVRLSLLLPGEPVATADRVSLMPGTSGLQRSYMSVRDSGVYGLTYLEGLPAALLQETWKREFFAGFAKEFAGTIQTSLKARGTDVRLTMSEPRAATAGGLIGYEQDFSYGTLMGRVKMVFDGANAYAVVAVWNGLSSSSERSAFFDSLQVNATR